MMRITVLILALAAFASCSRDRFVIHGKLSNADTLKLYLEEVDIYKTVPVDSAVPGNSGNFRFSRKIDMPGFYQLRLSNNQNIVFFPKPGDKISINADARNTTKTDIEGSEDTKQLHKLIENLVATRAKLDSLDNIFKDASEEKKTELMPLYDEIMESHKKFSIAFILTHYNSMAALYALYQQYQPGLYVFYKNTDLQFFRIVSDSLKKYYPESRHTKALEQVTDNLIGKYNSSLLLNLAEKSEPGLPAIALPGIAGDTLTLASMKSRYVLINFWASWSAESIENNRQLLRVYNNFKNRGFEVLAVSFDNSVDSWTRAIKFDELDWVNVIDEKFPNSIIAANYNITSLPVTYLVDTRDANIIAKNLTAAQLQDRLLTLMKQ